MEEGAELLKSDQKLVCKIDLPLFFMSQGFDWIETTAITYLSILIYNGVSYEPVTEWRLWERLQAMED